MGRLFWKFFAFVWLAQLAGIVAIAFTFWLTEPQLDRAFNDIEHGPNAGARLDAATAIMRYAGTEAFGNWSNEEPGPPVYVVDEAGRDILGRTVDPHLVSLARELRSEGQGHAPVREAKIGGHHYEVFGVGGGVAVPGGPAPGSPAPGSPAPGLRGPGLLGPSLFGPGTPRLVPSVVTLLASLATALGLAWYVAKPIRSLRTAFDAAAGGDLDVRVAPQLGDRRDELADLGRDFDRMAERLRASMEAQQRLLHDVSHEMRSPLARLQAATGRIRQRYAQEEPLIARIEEEIIRIDKLVGDLLKLSRLEAGEHAGAVEQIDMAELVREVVADADFEAQAGTRTVNLTSVAAGTVRGRPDMLQGAIENVIRNALKHAPECREVRVETEADPVRRTYRVRVIDDGPGVPNVELGVLFTPFFRAAGAARTEGYGLGLAIARRSIEAHHGAITASNRPEGGLLVTIQVPLAKCGTLQRGVQPPGCIPPSS